MSGCLTADCYHIHYMNKNIGTPPSSTGMDMECGLPFAAMTASTLAGMISAGFWSVSAYQVFDIVDVQAHLHHTHPTMS